jgi:hypothetical protein
MRTITSCAVLFALISPAFAQTTTLPTCIVNVAGGDMRVCTEGLDQPGIPVAVVISTPPSTAGGNSGALRLQVRKQADWALASSNGLFLTAGHVGHNIHRDDPALVMLLIDHVLKHTK